MDTAPPAQESVFVVIVAVLITVVTGFGGVAAWRIALADDDAGDYNYSGLAASVHAEEQRSRITADVYRQYQMFVRYKRFAMLGRSAAGETDPTVGQSEDLRDLAANAFEFFPTRFLNLEGTFQVERQIDERLAEAGLEQDINPRRHFESSDLARLKGSRLSLVPVVLALALFFFILAEKGGVRVRFAFAAVGGAAFVTGVVALLLVETAL